MLGFRRHPRFTCGIAGLLLVGYLFASLGVLPSPALLARWSGAILSERYPCADSGCACPSAFECWTHCACHNEHERLVWALKNGVMPPSYAVFTQEQWAAAAEAVRPGSAGSLLAVERVKRDLGEGIALAAAGSDDHGAMDCCRAPDALEESDGLCCGEGAAVTDGCGSCSEAGPSWPTPSLSALTCKGLQQLLLFSVPPARPLSETSLLPEPRTPYVFSWPQDEFFNSRTLETPEPPPRTV